MKSLSGVTLLPFLLLISGPVSSVSDAKEGNCYYDWPGRLLPKHVKSSDNMEPKLCQLLCAVAKFDYAGLQNGKECWCGSQAPPEGRKLDSKDCDKPCQGDKSIMCGGGYKMNIYQAYSGFRCSGIDGGCCTEENPCKEGDGDCDNDDQCQEGLFCASNNCLWGGGDDCCKKEKPGNCYYDRPGRLLAKHVKNSDDMEPKLCQLLCTVAKFDYAGLQNGKECWCGNQAPPAGRKLDSKDCDKPCQGDKSIMCGGGYKMNIYQAYSGFRCNGIDGGCCTEENPCEEGDGDCDNDDQCQEGLFCASNNCLWGGGDDCCKKEKPGNCYYDYPGRLLEKQLKSSDDMEPALCRELCGLHMFNYAGLQNGRECWCGIEPPPGNRKLNSTDCDKPCQGDKSIMCGGGYKMNIYQAYDHTEVIGKVKETYLGLQNDADSADAYSESVKELLPVLLNANALEENEVGVAYIVNHPGDYPLAILTGQDVITARVTKQTITINGTVTKKIGKRPFTYAKFRPTGLFAKPGDIITVTIPQELAGKLKAQIGQDSGRMIEFELGKSTQKIASPWGGLIIIYLQDIDATTEKGQFNVQVENGIQAPMFVYGQNTNDEWNNEIKKNAAPWSVLRIPGQLIIYIKTQHVNTVTDMEKVLTGWKETMDIGDDLLGIPLDLQPGEEQIHLNPINAHPGWRWPVCEGGGKSSLGDYPDGILKDNSPVTYHEMGHGYCYGDLPGNIGWEQWTAEVVREYIERKKKHPMVSRESKKGTPFNVLYRMVSFSKFSQGKPCNRITEFKKPSYPLNSYDNCWDYLYRIPLYEFGWDVLRKVFTTDATDTTEYESKTDRMADLYCKATESNLVPLFNFYNIKLSKEISTRCAQQKPPTMITQYINIANCIKNKDIKICAKLQGFPSHKGICTISGVCNKSPDTQTTVQMNNEYDLWGGTNDGSYKRGYKNTGQVKENCLRRAKEIFEWCGNARDQRITVTFSAKDGDSNASFPFQGNCYDDYSRLLPKHLESSSEMVPQRCRRKCGEKKYLYSGVQNHRECWCGNSPPPLGKQREERECDRACTGDEDLICGGGYRMNILKV